MIPHCIVILMISTVSKLKRKAGQTYMFSIPAAEDVLPNNKNHGLKPSEDFFKYILRC